MKNQFSIGNSLLGRTLHYVLPNKGNLENATSFALFIKNEVDYIFVDLPSLNISFEPLDQVSEVWSHPSSTLQTYWWADCREFIREFFASSLLPTSMKKDLVKPLLKRDNLDVDNLSNVRPTSQLHLFYKSLHVWLQIKSATSLNLIAFWITFKVLTLSIKVLKRL